MVAALQYQFPYELFACHTCDNPRCVNPRHIWVGDAAQNNHDARRKGRRGISYEKNDIIAEKYLKGWTFKQLIEEFNLKWDQVNDSLRSLYMVRKYGMSVPAYKRKLISEGKLPIPQRNGLSQLPK